MNSTLDKFLSTGINSYVAAPTILYSFTRDIVAPLLPYSKYIFLLNIFLLVVFFALRMRNSQLKIGLTVVAATSLIAWGAQSLSMGEFLQRSFVAAPNTNAIEAITLSAEKA